MAGTTNNPFSTADDTASSTKKPEPNATDMWQEALRDNLQAVIKANARDIGMYPGMAEQWVNANYSGILRYLRNDIMRDEGSVAYYTRTANGLTSLTNIALQWASSRIPGLRDQLSKGSGGGGGGGRVGAAPVDIRKQFDLSALAEDVSKMSRGYLLIESDDPRGVARAYVDAVVANPDQKLDFQQFVLDRLKADPRWNTLYKHKPATLDPLEYLQPYAQQAQQLLGANRGEEWSDQMFHAVSLGADPQAWQNRIERSNSYTSQAPFVAKISERAAGLSHILRG